MAIDNWKDIEILCGRNRVTSIGVEHIDDAVEVMAKEKENEMKEQPPCQYSLSTSFAAVSPNTTLLR